MWIRHSVYWIMWYISATHTHTKNCMRLTVLWCDIIIKDESYSLILSSKARYRILHKTYYTQEYTVSPNLMMSIFKLICD